MSALSALRSVRIVGTGLPSEAIPRASDLRMRGQRPPTTSCRPGRASTPPSHGPGNAMLAAHHEWHNALSRLADCDPAIKMTREKWLLPLVYELGWGHLEAITGGLCFPLGLTGDRSALRHLPRGLLAGQARPDRLDAPAPGWRERPLGHRDPRSAARAPQSMLRSASSLTPVDPPALAMISRMSNARSTDCTAPAVAFCASIMVSAPITQSKGTAPQCDSASIRHRDETSGYSGLPLERCGVFRVRPAGCMTRVTEHTGTSAMAR